jgi:type 1 glutamine amidotransferase
MGSAAWLSCSALFAACGGGDAGSWGPLDSGTVDAGGSVNADSGAPPASDDGGEREAASEGGTAGADSSTPSLPDASVEAAGPDPYSGPFKILVLSKTVGFHHDSIPAGQQMLRDLGACVDAASCAATNDVVIPGAKPNSSFTVDVAGAPANCPPATPANYTSYAAMGCDGNTADLTQFTSDNLKNYQMIFFVSPTGTVFSSAGQTGQAGMAAIQSFIESGGAYGGVHAASDFEDGGTSWPWYYNSLMGAYFTQHNGDGTMGTVTTDPMYLMHPVMRGIPASAMQSDEWYLLNRPMEMQPGFQVLETVVGLPPLSGEQAGAVRPMVWVKQYPVATDPTREGRMFYTARGHAIARYSEAPYRQLVHQGILWATHRLQ